MEEQAPLAAPAVVVEASAVAMAVQQPQRYLQMKVLPAAAAAMPAELVEPQQETMRVRITRSKTTAALAAEAQGSASLPLTQREVEVAMQLCLPQMVVRGVRGLPRQVEEVEAAVVLLEVAALDLVPLV
jgi:hypothetical protein